MKVRYDKVVIYVLRRSEDGGDWEILQMRRRKDVYLGGTWQFCSGGIEPGETAAEAAVRELREETGLFPQQLTFLSHVECFPVPMDTVWHRTGFCAVVDRGNEVQLNEEHTAFRWFSHGEIEECVMWPGEKAALEEIFREHLVASISRPFRVLDPYNLPKPPP